MADNILDSTLAQQIIDIIAKEGMVDRHLIVPEATLESLGLKSMDIVIILTGLEEKFDVYIPVDGRLAESKDVQSFVSNLIETIRQEKKA